MKIQLRILALALIAGGTLFAQTRFSFGVGFVGYGPGYYQPTVYQQYIPQCPGPGYVWVDGYWGPYGGRNAWIAGYWRPPIVGAYRVGPRYVGPRYYNSYRGYNRGYDHRRGYYGGGRGRGHHNGYRR